jgi:Ca-activated chloride channel family protein
MLHHAFAYPVLVWFLVLLPGLGVLAVWSRRERRRALARLGNEVTLETLLGARRRLPWLRGICLLLGLACLVLGSAGPQWGRDWEQSAAPGRDLVVVLDCSRSMFAETPSRLERARAMLLDLSRAVERRGGHRLALVLFAGRARLACPLTHDYDHFRDVVNEIDTRAPDPDLEPGPGGAVSGTRFGLGLTEAVAAQDTASRAAGARDILLLSDGDDPAHDGEWRRGADLARAEGIPVYTVGIGDPGEAVPIPAPGPPSPDGKNRWLVYDGREVRTRLEEMPLREIADRTHGTAKFPRTLALPLGEHYLDIIARQPEREGGDDALPVYRQHPTWFLLPAFVLLVLGMMIPERSRRGRRVEEKPPEVPPFALVGGGTR